MGDRHSTLDDPVSPQPSLTTAGPAQAPRGRGRAPRRIPSSVPVAGLLRFAILLLVTIALTGCGLYTAVRVTVNDHLDPEEVAFIENGTTTFREIVERLGTPDELMGHDRGAIALYHFRDAKYTRVNFGWPLRFWLPVQPDLIVANGALGTDVFEVVFDEQWVARNTAFGKHAGGARYRLWRF